MTKKLMVRIEKLADDACWSSWYYWKKNQHAWYLVWRYPEQRHLATGQIRYKEQLFHGLVILGLPQFTNHFFERPTLELAQQEIQRRVNETIRREMRPEYMPPLG